MGKYKIPKNRDIEEVIEKEEGSEQIKHMQDVIEILDKKEEEFRKKMQVKEEELDQKLEKAISKKVENHNKRKEAEMAEQKRQTEYLKAINKIEEEKEI